MYINRFILFLYNLFFIKSMSPPNSRSISVLYCVSSFVIFFLLWTALTNGRDTAYAKFGHWRTARVLKCCLYLHYAFPMLYGKRKHYIQNYTHFEEIQWCVWSTICTNIVQPKPSGSERRPTMGRVPICREEWRLIDYVYLALGLHQPRSILAVLGRLQ